jgi:alpha-L-fucosidase
MSGDGPSNLTTSTTATSASAADTKQQAETTAGVKEQIIYDLSLSNEKLEAEIKKYRQYVLDLRRAVRSQAGCSLEDSSILTLYPELNNDLETTHDDKVEENDEGDNDSSPSRSKDAATTSPVETGERAEEQQQQQNEVDSTKKIVSASVELENGRLSKQNSATSTRSKLP